MFLHMHILFFLWVMTYRVGYDLMWLTIEHYLVLLNKSNSKFEGNGFSVKKTKRPMPTMTTTIKLIFNTIFSHLFCFKDASVFLWSIFNSSSSSFVISKPHNHFKDKNFFQKGSELKSSEVLFTFDWLTSSFDFVVAWFSKKFGNKCFYYYYHYNLL